MAYRQAVTGEDILDLLRRIQLSPKSTLPHNVLELTELGINYTDIDSLPESISECRKVKKIFARGNKLTSLPQSISNLPHLTFLHLDENKFTAFPTSLYSHNNLRKLYLSNNQISDISDDINRMDELSVFWLSNNAFTTFPAALCGMTNLTELHLEGNQLADVPSEVSQMEKLTKFFLSKNAFTTFPINLCGMTNLKVLHMEENRISEIPGEINKMELLKLLNLASNNITHLPPQMKTMKNLTKLDVAKNPLVQPPEDIARRGVDAIRKYFEAFTDLPGRGLAFITIAEGRGKKASTDVKRTIPEKLKNDLLQFEFVDMFGFGQDSFQIYVCRKHFESNTDLDVINKLKTLVEEHGVDGKVVAHISSAPRRLSYFCGKEPPWPAVKIVKENNRYGSLGSYCRTDEADSKVYVLTNAHVASEGDIRLIQPGGSQVQSDNVCMHQRVGECNWSISTGTPSFVDIAAINVPSLGLRPGFESGPAVSVFSGDIESVVGHPVYKHGAQSYRTKGTIVGIDFVSRDENAGVCKGFLRVQGQNGTAFARPGDSGSLVRLAEDNKPLAMIFGGDIEMRDEGNGNHQGDEGNSNNQGETACFLFSEGLMKLERESGKKFLMVDETQLQCLIENFNG
ncbi:uncharacterized protein LOC106181623 [Lingula anatina]|uniref:Uncharacterized protein LOC106181623 n=1 Tax=Lingula anatina TaxID=7574 RepID=A0A1S3KFW5_LINAN|nr:uncharacterized protein LOC106181623 [Lingula anatina]|eukprot:XP_013421530.1 uncharacterized protein LOC106181623 [Lingula anatina]